MTVSCWRSNIHRHCEQSDESARSVLNVSIVPLCSHELLIEWRHSEAQSRRRSPSVKLKMRPFVKTIGLLLTAETLQTKVTSASISPSDWHNHAVLYPLITSPPVSHQNIWRSESRGSLSVYERLEPICGFEWKRLKNSWTDRRCRRSRPLRRSFNRFVDALTFTSSYQRWKKCRSSARASDLGVKMAVIGMF